MFDYLVVGAGLFGSIFAERTAFFGKKVLVIDKRDHIGGNCYTKKQDGIDVHVYGPHIFHTSDKGVWEYINKFTNFNNFVNRTKVNFDGKIYSFPINLFTLYQLWNISTPEEAKNKLEEVRYKIDSPKNLEEWILSQVGKELYEKFVYGYTKKQWMKEPKDLPSFIIKRLPIRLTYDDNYFNDTYQGIPIGGYTSIFEKMLEGSKVELSVDFFKDPEKYKKLAKKIVYTGKLDEYFNYCHGELEYRTLHFENYEQEGDFQGNAIINYTEENIPWTRITEHKHFQCHELNKIQKTIYTKEYPVKWHKNATPYYPICDQKNLAILDKYNKLKDSEKNVIFGGRLGNYRYYDMHQVIAAALHAADKELQK
jgi:UDP-galactopyranose mutase